MELRVWVDGTQRVVCGVKITTTCHEIVFALAHATQQAGRFTMIERWRNNERLLSPNEQPLVTLQRWGDHMNEVEFILRKTSSDPPPSQPQQPSLPTNHNQHNHLQASQPQRQSPIIPGPTAAIQDSSRTNTDNQTPQQQIITTNATQNNINNTLTSSSSQLLNDQTYDNMYHQRPFSMNATRRPQTIHGQLTSSSSSLSLAPNHIHNSHHALNRLSASFRPSLSASTLPNATTNNMSASPSNMPTIMQARLADDQMMTSNTPSMSNNFQNGYSIQSETQYQQQKVINQANIDKGPRNHPFEDLYGTINKKRNNQPPPVVPAKPRVLNSLGGMQPMSQNIYNTQMNYYHPNQSPSSLCPTTMRPRNPPGYLDYMEALATKNSLSQPIMSNSNHLNQSQNMRSNMFPRSYDSHHAYSYRQNSVSPPNSSKPSNNYCYQTNGQTNLVNHGQSHDGSPSLQNFNSPINTKLIDSGIVINRGSAVNIKLPSNIQSQVPHNRNVSDERLDTSAHSNASSVSQIGHDMLKVIEEQKRLLVNQKNELDKLDNDQQYWEARQISEQTELVNRIENEILQLEKLWKDNQTQIKKLENQDFEEVLENLKCEQVKIELDTQKQQAKLFQLENDIIQCKNKIEQLEAELARQGYNDSPSNDERFDERNAKHVESIIKKDLSRLSTDDKKESIKSYAIGSSGINGEEDTRFGKNNNNSDHDDDNNENGNCESSGENSDDLNSDSLDARIRSAKDVAYVDKRGLISGIRSLKLDKTRSINRQADINQSQLHLESTISTPTNADHHAKDNGSNNNNTVVETKIPSTNGLNENTANKYEFLMTL